MNLAARIAHNSIISAVTRILSLGVALVTVGLITRYLGTEGFGNYTTVIAFYFLITALSDFGINQILTREISRPDAREKDIMANVLGLRLTITLVLILVGIFGVFFLPYGAQVKNGIWIMFLALFFSSLSQTLNSIFQKKLVMNRLAWRELVSRFIQLGITYLAVKGDWGLVGILLAMVASFLFVLVASWELAGRYVKLKFSFDVNYWRFFLWEAAPLGIAAFVNFLYFKADAILLSLLRDSHDVGIYGAAYKVLESLIYFPFMFMGLVMPVFSYNIFHRPRRFLKIASRTLKAIWIVTVPLVVYLFFMAKEAIRVIAGAGFEEAVFVLQILAVALGAIFLAHFFNSVLIVVNKQKILLYILAGTAGLSLVLNIIFIPVYSFMAAAVISTVCEVLVTIIAYFLSRKWGIGWGKGWKPLPAFSIAVSSIGMVAVLYFISTYSFPLWQSIVIKGISGGAVYLVLLFATRGLKMAEIKEIFTISSTDLRS
ncbi:MAG: flippase [Candidatus Moranbacteria bacterium]|nr:flippase [Candidatus Moranbacteria bacterium]